MDGSLPKVRLFRLFVQLLPLGRQLAIRPIATEPHAGSRSGMEALRHPGKRVLYHLLCAFGRAKDGHSEDDHEERQEVVVQRGNRCHQIRHVTEHPHEPRHSRNDAEPAYPPWPS